MDWKFPMKSSANESYEKVPMVYNPMNQTPHIGKNPKELNPSKFLWESFESKKPLFPLKCGVYESIPMKQLALKEKIL